MRYEYEHSILPYGDEGSVWEDKALEPGHRVSVMIRVSAHIPGPRPIADLVGRTFTPRFAVIREGENIILVESERHGMFIR